jgi:hypothetical protein
MEVSIEALRFVFPEDLLAHFDLTQAKALVDKKGHEILEVEFTERNVLPEGLDQAMYEPKDFVERRVQDFPLRGRPVYLIIRRRRWRHKTTSETLTRDLSFIAEGTRLTKDIAAFLKEIGR